MEETIRIKTTGERVVTCRMVKDAINFIVDERLEHMEDLEYLVVLFETTQDLESYKSD
jgi:hypothetical protein